MPSGVPVPIQLDGPQLVLEYGARTFPAPHGFLITNHGAPAFGIQISNISNGRQLARFDEISQLSKTDAGDSPAWLPAMISAAQPMRATGYSSRLSRARPPTTVELQRALVRAVARSSQRQDILHG